MKSAFMLGVGALLVAGQVARPDNPQSLAHIEAAKKLAGDDAWLKAPFNFYCVAGNARGNSPTAPALEPVKLFDNLYAVGNSEATVYAITTSQGIVLIDSGYADRVEAQVVDGLKKLGLDPANVKYILLGHGHGDHFGGSSYFQEHYGTRVGTTAADWDLIYPANPPANAASQAKPKRDLVLTEGEPVKLGDETVTVVAIPGHTPGSLAFIFPVKDGRRSWRTAVRAVDCALPRGGEEDEGRRRTPEPRDLRRHAGQARRAQSTKARSSASVHRRCESLREVLVDHLGVHAGRNRTSIEVTQLFITKTRRARKMSCTRCSSCSSYFVMRRPFKVATSLLKAARYRELGKIAGRACL